MKREEENRPKKEYEKPQIVYQQSLEEVAAGCVNGNVKEETVGPICTTTWS